MYLCGLVNIVYQSLHNKHTSHKHLNLLSIKREDQPITFGMLGKRINIWKLYFYFFLTMFFFLSSVYSIYPPLFRPRLPGRTLCTWHTALLSVQLSFSLLYTFLHVFLFFFFIIFFFSSFFSYVCVGLPSFYFFSFSFLSRSTICLPRDSPFLPTHPN